MKCPECNHFLTDNHHPECSRSGLSQVPAQCDCSVWVVLRDYGSEGQAIQAVFDNERSAKIFCQKQETTVLYHSIIEKWQVHSTPNAQGEHSPGATAEGDMLDPVVGHSDSEGGRE